jgi:hypothetical protein
VLDDREPYGQGMALHFRAAARRLGVGLVGAASRNPMGRGLVPLARRVDRSRGIKRREGVSDVQNFEGAAVVRVIRPQTA